MGALSLYCGDPQMAEELAQNALIRVVSNRPRVRDFDSPSAWTFRVAINLANSYLHRRDRPVGRTP